MHVHGHCTPHIHRHKCELCDKEEEYCILKQETHGKQEHAKTSPSRVVSVALSLSMTSHSDLPDSCHKSVHLYNRTDTPMQTQVSLACLMQRCGTGVSAVLNPHPGKRYENPSKLVISWQHCWQQTSFLLLLLQNPRRYATVWPWSKRPSCNGLCTRMCYFCLVYILWLTDV